MLAILSDSFQTRKRALPSFNAMDEAWKSFAGEGFKPENRKIPLSTVSLEMEASLPLCGFQT